MECQAQPKLYTRPTSSMYIEPLGGVSWPSAWVVASPLRACLHGTMWPSLPSSGIKSVTKRYIMSVPAQSSHLVPHGACMYHCLVDGGAGALQCHSMSGQAGQLCAGLHPTNILASLGVVFPTPGEVGNARPSPNLATGAHSAYSFQSRHLGEVTSMNYVAGTPVQCLV